jgi:hypothetical protein
MYAKALIGLFILSDLLAGIWKLYDAGGDAREAEVRLELAQVQAVKDQEILRQQNEKAKASVTREIIYRGKIKTVYQINDNCLDTIMPAELLQAFCEVGLAGSSLCETPVTR